MQQPSVRPIAVSRKATNVQLQSTPLLTHMQRSFRLLFHSRNSTLFMETNKTENPGGSRRSFIKKTAAVTAAAAATGILKTPVYGQNQAPSPGRVIGAN